MAAERRPGNLAHLERCSICGRATTPISQHRWASPSTRCRVGAGDDPRRARSGRYSSSGVRGRREYGVPLWWSGPGVTRCRRAGKLTERTEITRAGLDPAPQRCKIKLAYRDRPFATLDFELGRAEAYSFELLEQIPSAVDMDKVQLGRPRWLLKYSRFGWGWVRLRCGFGFGFWAGEVRESAGGVG